MLIARGSTNAIIAKATSEFQKLSLSRLGAQPFLWKWGENGKLMSACNFMQKKRQKQKLSLFACPE